MHEFVALFVYDVTLSVRIYGQECYQSHHHVCAFFFITIHDPKISISEPLYDPACRIQTVRLFNFFYTFIYTRPFSTYAVCKYLPRYITPPPLPLSLFLVLFSFLSMFNYTNTSYKYTDLIKGLLTNMIVMSCFHSCPGLMTCPKSFRYP